MTKAYPVSSVALIILVDCFYHVFVNPVASEMVSGEGLYPRLLRPSSGRETARHSRWSVAHDSCSASELVAHLRPSALPEYQGLKCSLLLMQKSQLPDQKLI